MLLKIKVENFLSFYKASSFDMFPNVKRTTFPSHVYGDFEIPLLKQAVIYGANGSGKSNLLRAIKFIKEFAENKDFITDEVVHKSKFRLHEGRNLKPIQLSIEFKNEDDYFKYHFEINDNLVVESLSLSGIGKQADELIYSRTNNTLSTGKNTSEEVANAITKLLDKNPYSSLLSLNNEFPIINDTRVLSAFEWFESKLTVLTLNRYIPSLINLMANDEKLLRFTNHLFNKIDLGVDSLEIESKNMDSLFEGSNIDDNATLKELLGSGLESNSGITKMKNDKVLFTIIKENEEQIIKKFIFNQIGQNGFKGKMDIEDQSDGTIRLLNLIPALFEVIEKEKVICVDEIENSIHPTLISALISFFSNSNSKGQLIFTTHETELLNQQKLMRPDEVWFAEKHDGDTQLYSLNDFKEHNTINIKNGYLDGRYGAIPFIGTLDD
jgi:AAA15 family ATPase/GTPase